MSQFWEFFTFELKIPVQEHFDIRLLLYLDRVFVSLGGVGKLWADRQQ
jgi:hypothetical protein